MGVPAFFRWLSLACPKVVVPALPAEARRANSGGYENDPTDLHPAIDCLYLDMNALIHPCSHPTSDTDIPVPANEDEMHRNIKEYIDMVVEIVGPKKLLYLAIDGVAPRAKMNQQRGRRFRSAQEIYAGKLRKRRLADLWAKEGFEIPEEVVEATHWDYNVITPGTTFMKKVSQFLRNYIAENLMYNPKWANLQVIYSDANSPGEGEHKILDFIRRQRGQPGYDPNTSHCIYGADADLIMLSLSTHEAHFYIIRESITNNLRQRGKEWAKEVKKTDAEKKKIGEDRASRGLRRFSVDFNFINIFYVREFLDKFYSDVKAQLRHKWDLENLIDDFVFLCFFGGNDFLPHLPALSIHQGGIDILMHLHRRMLPDIGGYLTTKGEVNLLQVEKFMKEFAKSEESILRQIEQNQKELNIRNPRVKVELSDRLTSVLPDSSNQSTMDKTNEKHSNGKRPGIGKIRFDDLSHEEKKKLEEKFKDEAGMLAKFEEEKNLEVTDSLYFIGAVNYKESFYRSKFDCDALDAQDLKNNVRDYFVEGLLWNMAYYYKGCTSWEWFYPYYYAPFPSDFVNIQHLQKTKFNMGEPFESLQQLMAVLPPYSSHALPEAYRELMLNPESEIIDFYPSDFEVDVRGKRFAWLGEVILPLIEPDRLKKATKKMADKLTDEERQRNKLGEALIFHKLTEEHQHQSEISFGDVKGTFVPMDVTETLTLKETKQQLREHLRICTYIVPEFDGHKCQLLPGVDMPVSDVRDIHDYERRSRVSEACIRIIDQNLDRKSIKEVHGLILEKRIPEHDVEPINDEVEELSKPTKRVKTH